MGLLLLGWLLLLISGGGSTDGRRGVAPRRRCVGPPMERRGRRCVLYWEEGVCELLEVSHLWRESEGGGGQSEEVTEVPVVCGGRNRPWWM